MGGYYYLMAQLPYLVYGQEPPMSSDNYKTLAESLMGDKDALLMNQLYLDPDPILSMDEGPAYENRPASTGCEFIDRWRDWERTLRLNAARHRAVKTKRDNGAPVEPPVLPTDAVAVASVAIVGTESPLEAENIIDKARWNAIEAIAGDEYFNRNTVFAYYLKLALLERQATFKTDEGFAEYKALYASILENAQHSVGEPK